VRATLSLACLGLLLSGSALAQQAAPASPTHALALEALRVSFHVQSLFPVDGTFGPVSGELRFEPEGGAMSGELRVDAASADTGYGVRDAVIRNDVLHVERYPLIVFRPTRWRVRGRTPTQLSGSIEGSVLMHGVERPVTVELEAQLTAAGEANVRAGLAVQFEEWGIANPGNEYLPVEPRVGITVEGVARSRPL